MAVDEVDRRYRACCDATSARSGAKLIILFEIAVAVFFIIYGIICQTQFHHRYNHVAPIFYALGIGLLCSVAVLALGLFRNNKCLLILHMIKSAFFIVILIVLMILGILVIVTTGTGAAILHIINDDSHHNDKENFVAVSVTAIVAVAVMGIYAILQIWFILIVLSAYRAIRDHVSSGGVVLTPVAQPMMAPAPVHGGNVEVPVYYPTTTTDKHEEAQRLYPTAPPPYAA